MRILSKNEIKKLGDETVKQTKQLMEDYMVFSSQIPSSHLPAFVSVSRPGCLLVSYLQSKIKEMGSRAERQLTKMDPTISDNKDRIFEIVFRELYIDKRISMECSKSEGMGISSALDGLFGEKLTVFELELCVYWGLHGTILHNLEFEVGNRTIQIDLLFVSQKGIFVIESKNYSGVISGAEYQSKWKLGTRYKDYMFHNPIAQNQVHMNVLRNEIHCGRMFSLIVFSEGSKLEYMDIHSRDVFVCNLYSVRNVLSDVFLNEPDMMSEQDIDVTVNKLQQYCADNPLMNPNYKEVRGYYSAYTKSDYQDEY